MELTSARKRGEQVGTRLSGRSVELTLGRSTAALETAVAEGNLVRNVARLVKPPKHEQREKSTWSPEQVRGFLVVAAAQRLHAAWRMSL